MVQKKPARKKVVRLPHKMSALIMLALGDLMKVERSKKYTINMGIWHEPDWHQSAPCSVCFAGSVMAKTLDTPLDDSRFPEHFSGHNSAALYALNALRSGSVDSAAAHLGKSERRYAHFCRFITHYSASPKLFRADMRRLAHDLAKAGL